MKIIAIANNLEDLEKLINEYFDDVGYQVILIKRVNEKSRITMLKYILENKRLDHEKVILLNIEYKIIFKKGRFYFYYETKR